MKSINWLGMGLLAAGMMVGCGDDGGSDPCPPPVDAGMVDTTCSALQPDPGQVYLAGTTCCARVDNTATPEDFALRITAISLSSPTTLASPVVTSLLNRSLDLEGFNWLVEVTNGEDEGALDIRTGFALRDSDGTNSTYHFYDHAVDNHPQGGPRWNAVDATGSITGNDIMSDPSTQGFSVPVFNEAELLATGNLVVDLELPLQALELDNMTVSTNRSCVGDRLCNEDSCGDLLCSSYDDQMGDVTTYIGTVGAEAAVIQVPPLDGVSLCALIGGSLNTVGCTPPATRCCGATDPSTWPSDSPDSYCDSMTGACTQDPGNGSVCGPSGSPELCNAWQLTGNFAAHGVTNTAP